MRDRADSGSRIPEAALRGIELHRRGEYFAAHEAIEEAWLEAEGPERELLQALIQISVACHHNERGNVGGAIKMLRAAAEKLSRHQGDAWGLDVGHLSEDVSRMTRDLSAGEVPKPVAPALFERTEEGE